MTYRKLDKHVPAAAREYFSRIGKVGGKKSRPPKRERSYYQEMGRKSGEARRRKNG
jgi:hypothetical protein